MGSRTKGNEGRQRMQAELDEIIATKNQLNDLWATVGLPLEKKQILRQAMQMLDTKIAVINTKIALAKYAEFQETIDSIIGKNDKAI